MTNTNRPYSPSPEYRYFLYDPNDGHTFYRTPEERDIAAKSLIKDYLVDGEWSEQVVDIYAGEATHLVSEVERIDKVGELDEDGYDENGEYWADDDVDYKCNYDLRPLVPTLPANHFPGATEMVAPPADRIAAAKLAAELRHFLAGYQQMRGLDPEYIYSIHRGDAMEAHLRVSRLIRVTDLLQQQAAELAILRQLAEEILALVGESDGVAGLHLNGDIAPWDELLPGGRFERLTLPDANV